MGRPQRRNCLWYVSLEHKDKKKYYKDWWWCNSLRKWINPLEMKEAGVHVPSYSSTGYFNQRSKAMTAIRKAWRVVPTEYNIVMEKVFWKKGERWTRAYVWSR